LPRGTRHTLTGLLLRNGPQFVLRIDDGGEWRLDSFRGLQRYCGQRVSVSGVRDGFDLLSVEKIEQI